MENLPRNILWGKLKGKYAEFKIQASDRLAYRQATKKVIINQLNRFNRPITTIRWKADATLTISGKEQPRRWYTSAFSLNPLTLYTSESLDSHVLNKIKKYFLDYNASVIIHSYSFKQHMTPHLPAAITAAKMRRLALNSVVYMLDDARISKYQDSSNCMLNYIVERANDRHTNLTKIITESDITAMLKRDIEETRLNGISIEETEAVCEELNMSCKAVMVDNRILSDIRQSNPGLMFKVHNGHCYPIADACRRSFAQSFAPSAKWIAQPPTSDDDKPEPTIIYSEKSLESVIKYTLRKGNYLKREGAKRKAPVEPKPKTILLDVSYFPQDEVLKAMRASKLQFNLKISGGKINSLKIGNMEIKAISDRENQIEFCDKYEVQAGATQTLSKLVSDNYVKTHGAIPQSFLNAATRQIILNEPKEAFNLKFVNKLSGNEKGVDIVKCYSAAISKKQFFPVYSPLDSPQKFNGRFINVGKYYVKTSNMFPLRGNGWYSHVLVKYALKQKVIKRHNIKFELISQYKMSSKKFKEFVEHQYKTLSKDTAKKVVNYFTGNLAKTDKHKEVNYITSSLEEALSFISTAEPESKIKHNVLLNSDGEEELQQITIKTTYKKFHTNLPIYHQVLAQGRISAYELYKHFRNPVCVKTDCITYVPHKNDKPFKYCDVLGGYRIDAVPCAEALAQLPHLDLLNKLPNPDLYLKSMLFKPSQFNTITHDSKTFAAPAQTSYMLNGFAGTGKSHIINNTIDEKYKRLAFSNTAANNIKGSTIHSYLKMSAEDISATSATVKALRNNDLVIDEYSMIPESLLMTLTEIKANSKQLNIIMAGDSRQIQYITRDASIKYLFKNKEIPRMCDSYALAYLCDFNKVDLNYCHRADKAFATNLINGDFGDVFRGRVKEQRALIHEIDIHVCITNNEKDKINVMKYNANKGKVLFTSKEFGVFKKNTPWITSSSFTTPGDKRRERLAVKHPKNEYMRLIAYDKKNKLLVLKSEASGVIACVKVSQFYKLFDMRYAMTVNKLQGYTITKPFIIHEWYHKHNDIYKAYTSCSRATHTGQYYIFD